MLAAVVLGAAAPGWARAVTFAEARAAATREAPDVQLAQGRAHVLDAEVHAAGALANPTLTVTTARETARLGTGVSVPLPLLGQRATAVRAARADAAAATLDVAAVRRAARWGATVAWIDLWEAQAQAERLAAAAAAADRLHRIAAERFQAGTSARLDVVQTSADRARAAAEAEAARLEVGAAAARLAPWIGAAPDEGLAAAGTPAYPLVLPPLASLLGRLPAHPELRRDRAQVAASGAHVRHEQRLRWPIVDAQLTVDQYDPSLPGRDVIFGLSFELPVLSLRAGAVARARAAESLAAATLSADERRLRAEVVAAYRRAEGANAKLRSLREAVLPAIQEAEQMTEDGYRAGRIALLRVLEAQRALRDTRLAESEAFAAWGRAAADLERAAGADLGSGGGDAP